MECAFQIMMLQLFLEKVEKLHMIEMFALHDSSSCYEVVYKFYFLRDIYILFLNVLQIYNRQLLDALIQV